MSTALDTKALIGTYNIDQSHSSVEFVARHLVISKVRGRFSSFSGQIVIAENPLDSHATARIDTNSIDTNEEKRDEHLRSADFFNTSQYPTITYQSTSVKEAGNGQYILVGDLTIAGKTNQVDLELEVTGTAQDPWGNSRVGFSASTAINRSEFGLTWNQALETGGVVVSDKIDLNIEIEAVKAQ